MILLLPIGLALLASCSDQPDWCADREDDADCDGVPDDLDRCPETAEDTPTDRTGCSEAQAAGCSVQALEPEDRARLDPTDGTWRIRWTGDCDVYLVQVSADPSFPAGATRTALRTTASEVSVALDPDGDTRWRIVGGLTGASAGYATPAREIRWR